MVAIRIPAMLDATLEAPTACDATALAPGDVVDGMTVVGSRFRGGFAHVYEARLGDRRVALKLLLPHLVAVRGAADRLRLEAVALAELDHAHIVEIVACGEHRGWPYIAMEWLDGRSLADEIAERGALPVATVLAILEQIGGAVAAAHARGIVHRDLKAHNVVVLAGEPTVTKLVDFGIAKLVRPGAPGLTTTMQVLGTPIAMAPEQILGGTIDERTDIYGLGGLLYHALTGRPAFVGKTSVETEELHLSAAPPRPSDVVAIPPAIDAVIRRSMAKNPNARHSTVAAFLDDLRDALADRPAVRHGAAVYVEAELDGDPRPDGPDDDDLDALDQVMVDAQRALCEAGLEILAEANNAILAGAALPGDGADLRRRALAAALAIAKPRMRVRVRAAVDALAAATSELGPAAVAGLPPGLVATADALDGIGGLVLDPIVERPGVFRVRAR